MARQYYHIITMSAVAIALSTVLSACSSNNDTQKTKPQATTPPTQTVQQNHVNLVTHHSVHSNKNAQPVATNLAPIHHTAIHPAQAVKRSPSLPANPPMHFTPPKNHFIFVVDANHATITNSGAGSYTLTIPVSTVSQVAEFIFTQNTTPTYFLGQHATQLWQSAPQNIFANEHAIISAKYNTPHAILITGESLTNNNIVFNINSKKPFNGYHLKNVVLNIRGQN